MPAANTGGSPAQAAGDPQPPEGTPQGSGSPAGTAQAAAAGSEGGSVDVAALQREAEEARREAAKYRTSLRALEEQQRQAQQATLTDAERNAQENTSLKSEVATLKAALADERMLNRVMATAGRLGFADPIDAFRLLERDKVEVDDDGEPKNLQKMLSDLLSAKPYLASSAVRATGSAEGGARGSGAPSDMNRLIRQAAGRT